MHTPRLETERLILRRFTHRDTEALFSLLSDEEVNRFLPWYPLKNMEQAREFFEERYAQEYARPQGYAYAVCLRTDDVPIGYVKVDMGESHDLGYGLSRAFWNQGLMTEAAGAVVERAKIDGLPYITATHDVNNPQSGRVMQKLGMTYRYSYEEQWQPKNIPVIFRMYQINFADESFVYQSYWKMYQHHFIEEI